MEEISDASSRTCNAVRNDLCRWNLLWENFDKLKDSKILPTFVCVNHFLISLRFEEATLTHITRFIMKQFRSGAKQLIEHETVTKWSLVYGRLKVEIDREIASSRITIICRTTSNTISCRSSLKPSKPFIVFVTRFRVLSFFCHFFPDRLSMVASLIKRIPLRQIIRNKTPRDSSEIASKRLRS